MWGSFSFVEYEAIFKELANEEGLDHSDLKSYFQKSGIEMSDQELDDTFKAMFKGKQKPSISELVGQLVDVNVTILMSYSYKLMQRIMVIKDKKIGHH